MTDPSADTVRPLYLNGEWVVCGEPLQVTNPATLEMIGAVSTVGQVEVRKALEDAEAVFPAWREATGKERGGYLRKVASLMQNRADEFARAITLENGKPLAQSHGEVGMAIDHLQWFAEEARRGYGRVVPHQAPGKRHLVIRRPVGVVGAIAPWNFPLVLALRKVAAGMAAGCPVVLKPASATPLSSVLLAELMHAAGVPAGVFQLVAGKASVIGQEMLSNPACRKVSFTGSTEVGKELMRGAAAQVKNLSLELGGHAPVLVFDDADLGQAVEGAMITKFRNTGQSCVASNRLYVQRSIYDAFMDKFVTQTQALKVGNGLDDGVDIGPLIDEAGLECALAHIEDAVARGAEVVCGGKAAEGAGAGHFLEPTILTGVPSDARCMREETFAPVMPVLPFDDEEEAVAAANDTPYGLASYAFTRDIARVWRLSERLDAGSIAINDAVPAASPCPFGGTKESGLERELGTEGLNAYLETKHISLGGID